jgi:hypothetical protein
MNTHNVAALAAVLVESPSPRLDYQIIQDLAVLARNRSWESTPDPDVYVLRQSDVIGRFVDGTVP